MAVYEPVLQRNLEHIHPSANALTTSTYGTLVDVASAAPPSSGQVLTATSQTTATWQTPAPAYTEIAPTDGSSVGGTGAWEDWDLTSLGIPALTSVDVMIQNVSTTNTSLSGVRKTGSALARNVVIQTTDSTVMITKTDASKKIQRYSQLGGSVAFYILGYYA